MTSPTSNSPVPYVLCTGVESTGKTTLVEALATRWKVPAVREAARFHPDVMAHRVQLETLHELVHLQNQAIQEAQETAHRLNARFCWVDTGVETLALWAEHAFGACLWPAPLHPPGLLGCLVCAPVLPWEPDPLRTLPHPADRWSLHTHYLQSVRSLNVPTYILSETLLTQRVEASSSWLHTLTGW